ncbi:MAG TPA: MoaD/ThiS family protein [Anaerolineae bacterium]|nr:MoaD/ThiS family protein [Anaerolineae bacterium]
MAAREVAVVVELLSGLGGSLADSQRGRALLEEKVREGDTWRELFQSLGTRIQPFAERVWDLPTQQIDSQILVILNGRLVRQDTILESAIEGGDRIVFVPPYQGG